jgi:hypothetical protein
MNASKNLAPTLLKATLLATFLFWTLIFEESSTDLEIVPFMFLSVIPISIVCSLTILITVMPFHWFKNEELTNPQIFKKFFPYYSIIAFVISSYCIVNSNFNHSVNVFFMTAFFTLLQSWIWLFKTPKHPQKMKNNLKSKYNDKIQ